MRCLRRFGRLAVHDGAELGHLGAYGGDHSLRLAARLLQIGVLLAQMLELVAHLGERRLVAPLCLNAVALAL